MATKTKTGKPRYGVSSPITWVWGDRKKGASVFKVTEKSVRTGKPISGWWVYLWKNEKPVYRQVDYPTKKEAVEYARGLQKYYATYAR